MTVESADVSLEELDYHLESGVTVLVDEKGSDEEFIACVNRFVEEDVARDGFAKVYEGEVTEVRSGSYRVGHTVRIDNRDVVRVF